MAGAAAPPQPQPVLLKKSQGSLGFFEKRLHARRRRAPRAPRAAHTHAAHEANARTQGISPAGLVSLPKKETRPPLKCLSIRCAASQ
jgi:hypothetical protein